jgi:small-conductance mechanosensitive channel
VLALAETLIQLQETFSTLGSQLLGTAAVLTTLAVLVLVIREMTPFLLEQFDDITVETARAATITTLATVAGLLLVVIWQATDQLLIVLGVLEFSREDIIRAVFSVVLLGTAYTVTRATKRTVRRLAVERGAISRHQQEVGHHVVQLGVYLIAVTAVLALWRIDISNLLLGAGFLGLVLGLAARQTLGAVLAGFVVLFSRPFKLGDWVEIADYEGIVQDISIVNTQLKTPADEVVMIPNDRVTSTEVINRSRMGRYRVEVDVGVDYGTDIDRAAEIAENVLAEAEHVLDRPTPQVVIPELGDSSVVLRLRFWIDNPSAARMWRAKSEVTEGVKAAFEREGIEIPFPQRVLTPREEDGFRLTDTPDADAPGGDSNAHGDSTAGDEDTDPEGR